MARNYINTAPPIGLTVGATSVATTLTVASTAGYPDPPFLLGLERGTANEEVVLCTSKSSTTFTVERGYDGTTGRVHAIGTSIEHTVAAIDYRETFDHIESVGAVHGVSEVVGRTETQTLTGKSISGTSNTITGLSAHAVTRDKFHVNRIPDLPYAKVMNLPPTFPSAPHTHPASDITGKIDADTINGRTFYVQSSTPTGAQDGDIWFEV